MRKRFVAMLAVAALLAGSALFYYHKTGTRTDGVFYDATGIRPDAPLIRVDGTAVTAEEYFYWLDSVCEYLASYAGGTPDFSAAVTEEMTLGQFAKADAANTVILYAVVRDMARQYDITLTEEDLAQLDAQHRQYVAYYGSQEAYLQQLQLLGITQEMMQRIEEVPYLYNRLFRTYADPEGKLYPGEDALRRYGEEKGFVTAQLLYFPTAELTDSEKSAMRDIAADYAAQLTAAADKQGTYATLATQLGLTVNADGLTFCAADSDAAVYRDVSALKPGQVSGIMEGGSGFYVALRTETNYAALSEDLFNIYLQDRQDSAKVEYSDRYYDRIDAGSFYIALREARSVLMQALSKR